MPTFVFIFLLKGIMRWEWRQAYSHRFWKQSTKRLVQRTIHSFQSLISTVCLLSISIQVPGNYPPSNHKLLENISFSNLLGWILIRGYIKYLTTYFILGLIGYEIYLSHQISLTILGIQNLNHKVPDNSKVR